jgi:hypothetical protein
VNKSIRQIAFGLFLVASIVGCAPSAGFFNRIPVPPFGNSWKLEIKDADGKVVLDKKYERGNQFQRFELAKPTTSGNVLIVTGDALKDFYSNKIILPKINLEYTSEVVELKSDDMIGVAMYVSDASSYQQSSVGTLFIYPDNTKTIYKQLGCRLSISKPDEIEFSGYSFLAEPAANQLPLGAYLPTTPQKGTCSLKKIIATE